MLHRMLAALALVIAPQYASAQETDLALKARKVLASYCYPCHGKDGRKESGFGYVLDARQMLERKRVMAGNPDKSRIFLRMTSSDEADMMPPPDEKTRPGKDDIALVKRWIESGAAEFSEPSDLPSEKRPLLTLRDNYQAMYQYLLKAQRSGSARYQRFFTLTHLHNNSRITEEQLRLHRAGLAKLLNSLSWRKAIVLPRPIDTHGTVLALDVRELDWDLNDNWEKIVGASRLKDGHKGYPYGLTHDRYPEDDDLNVIAQQVYKLTGTELPDIRADWFLATASQPPLYHELLHLPTNAYDLEQQLKVNVVGNFLRDQLARGGFVQSGVSGQNRLVERHNGLFGAYWKSFDFKTEEDVGNLMKYPLGPLNLFAERRHPYANQAFVHAGGELIWALPNGLHAYMLIDGKGNRINEGPTDVVRDPNNLAGKGPIIVNGLSCMGCHKHGMIEFKDEVRLRASLQGTPLEKVRRLYPETKVMDRLVEQDEQDYLSSLEQVVGIYLRVGADKKKDLKSFPEPVTLLATPYLRGNVRLDEAALELGLPDAKYLQTAIKANSKLRDELGLKGLADGGVLKRAIWESVVEVYSPFQNAAAELQLGTPVLRRRLGEDLP